MSETGTPNINTFKKSNWKSCDFCRVKKPTKFKSEHVEITSTDEGKFQGPTCSLSFHNTEILPCTKENKIESLEAPECVSLQSIPKKKKKSIPGITISDLKMEQDREYKEMLKMTAEENKHNKKIALERQKNNPNKISEVLGPKWYQELSYRQMMYVEMLGESLKFDLQEGILTRTDSILAGLGIFPRPPVKEVSCAAYKCFMNPILFLLYLYKHIGKTPLKPTANYYSVNERLMLSAVAHLALPRTLLDLHSRLPVLPLKDIKEYPAISRRKRNIHTSPYMESQPFFKHCYEEERRKEIEKRKKYLTNVKERNAAQEKLKMEISSQLTAINSPPGVKGTNAQSLGFSKKHDGCDQIPTLEQRRAITKTPDTIVRSNIINREYQPSSKVTQNTSNDKNENIIGNNNSISNESEEVGEFLPDINNSYTEGITSEQEVSNTNAEIKQEGPASYEHSLTGQSLQENLSLDTTTETEETTYQNQNSQDSKLERSLLDNSTHEAAENDDISVDLSAGIVVFLDPHDSVPGSFPVIPETESEHGNFDIEEEKHTHPIFLSLERSAWCTCHVNRTFKPIFLENTCGYSIESKTFEPEIGPVIMKSSSEELLNQKSMQLPFPILTRPTIKALVTGYWQEMFNPFYLVTLSDSEIHNGEKDIFNILTKKALFDMAKSGNPLACLPNVHLLPQIQQLIRLRLNFKLTKDFKEKLMFKSYDRWNATLQQSRTTEITHLKIDKKIKTWDHIKLLKKMVNKHATKYRSNVRQALVDEARDFWGTMFLDYFNNPRFRNVFFSYLPSKEEDILPVHPWE